MKRILDLPAWPPTPSGPFAAGMYFPISPEQVTVREVLQVVNNRVDFNCCSGREIVRYRFQTPSGALAGEIAAILKGSIGLPLLTVGMVEIPEV